MSVDQLIKPIFRISKVCALGRDFVEGSLPSEKNYQYFVLLDGGHKINVDSETAMGVAFTLDDANKSDESFFKRGG
jgi:hypothetical protein